jgi:4-hydroxysphinganine ceramide fatty acyl 2-hydroxylase
VYNANFTFEEYVTFINEPKHFTNPVRDILLFHNWFLEAVSQGPMWHVPFVYSFLALYCVYNMYYVNYFTNPIGIFLVMFIGALTWTLTEYVLHRFLFHGEDYWMLYMPQSKYLYFLHFITHGIHHAFPQDRYRIVFPPIPGIVLFLYPIFWRGFTALIP